MSLSPHVGWLNTVAGSYNTFQANFGESPECELRLYGVLRSSQNIPSTRGIPAPDCSRANSQDSCEVPSVWCALLERSRFLLFFAPLVGTCNAQPLRCFGPKHISAKGYPTGSSLLQKIRAGRAVEEPGNLIRATARASSGGVHTSP